MKIDLRERVMTKEIKREDVKIGYFYITSNSHDGIERLYLRTSDDIYDLQLSEKRDDDIYTRCDLEMLKTDEYIIQILDELEVVW